MLKRSELAIVKDGVLTLNGYSFAMIYKMIGICANPGKYFLGKDNDEEDVYLVSDGKSVWMANKDDVILFGDPKSKEELEYVLEQLNHCTKHSVRYYEVDGILYREDEDKLYYLIPTLDSTGETIYSEQYIPMSVIFEVIKPDFPAKSVNESMIHISRIDSMKGSTLSTEYLDDQLDYFGYVKVEDYYVFFSFDEALRIDKIENGKVKSLKTTLESLKKVLII